MTDLEVLALLFRIDDGYKPTGAEKNELSSIRKITWLGIDNIPVCIDLLIYLKELDLSGTFFSKSKLTSIPESIGNLTSLKSLTLRFSQISAIPECIGNLTNLQRLNLSDTRISVLPESIGNLTNLQRLDLNDTRISVLPESIGNLTSLQSLDLSLTRISALPECIGNLTSLQKLYLVNTQLSVLPDNIGNLTNLQRLDLRSTQIRSLPESIVNLTSLQSLNLRHTMLRKLPDSIGNLTSLQFIILEDITLAELPASLLHLNLEYINQNYSIVENRPGIYINGLTLTDQDITIFSQNRELILEYYKSLRQNESIPINECKVVFLGDGGAGKSLIIDRLMHDGNKSDDFDGESTPGIHISSKKYSIGSEEIDLHFWDFGGQAIMHSMHRLFLTNRTLYVVVTNARDNKANEQAWYWIRNIKSFANGAPVLLLVNQKDQNPSANVNKNGLRKEYPSLKDVRIISALKDSKEEFLSDVSDSICRIVSKMDTVHTPFSKTWLALMNDLQEMPVDVIKSQKFYDKCKDHGVGTEKKQLDQIISWFQDLGVCFYSRRHPNSKRYMVLKPRWMLNALYILIFNGRYYAVNGIIKENDIYELICRKVPDKNIKQVYSEITYEEDQIQYILTVLLNYELIYRLDEQRLFIPMLCDENEPNSLGSFVSEDALQISFEYTYLPENVLHKLMVRHGYDLITKVVWRTGAMFHNSRCGWSALVRMKDNCLDVFATTSQPETHPVNVYLDILRESISKINESFGIAAQEFITYRKDGRTDRFEYEMLRGTLELGIHTMYSKVFGSVSIEEVLGIVSVQERLRGQRTDSQINVLLNALSDVLLKLQENSYYYSAEENLCNTYVRDMLQQRGYICNDQTLRAVSGTGISAGSLDMLICDKDTGKELSIFEAQRLKGFVKQDQNKLDDHLKRLLDNYNARGLRNLLLVSYVAWNKVDFKDLADSYCKYVASGKSAPFTTVDNKLMNDFSDTFLRCFRVGYDCGGMTMYVYHIMVRLSK